MKLGNFELDVVSAGTMAMDGGLMFGVVPRVMWEKFKRPDERNRVRLGLNVMLIRTPEASILVDTGCGEALPPKLSEIHSFRGRYQLREALQELGIGFDDIDIVIPTHLHFDHAGGMTTEENGRMAPSFPNARYLVQKREYQEWKNTNERTRGGYRAVYTDVIEDAGLLDLLDGEHEVVSGVGCIPTPGHTEGHQSVLVDSGNDRRVIFLGDVAPTRHNIPLPWTTSNDVLPLIQLETKRSLWKKAVDNGWELVFPHEISPRFFGSEVLGNAGSSRK